MSSGFFTSASSTGIGLSVRRGILTCLDFGKALLTRITQPLTEFSQVGDGNQWSINEASNYIEPILKLSGDGINAPITVNYAVDFDGTLSDSAVNSRGINSIRLVLGYGKRLILGDLTLIVLYDAPGLPTGGNPTNVSFNISKQYRDWETDRKSTRLNSSHSAKSRMPSSA